MKNTGFIKFVLVIFVIVAIFNYRGDSLNDLAIKTGMFLRGFSTSSSSSSSNGTSSVSLKANVKDDELDKVPHKKQIKEVSTPKVSSSDDSIVGNFIANVLNKLLETPNGQILIKESLGRAASRNQFSQGQDIAERKYLSIDSLVGKGREVKCGDEVEISYNIYKPSDKSKKNKNKLRTRIVVGNNNLPKPFEGGLLGMKEGGERRVLYFVEDILKTSKEKNERDNYKQMISEVRLEKVHTPVIDSKDKIRVFVHNPSRIGKRVLCGDYVNFVYKVTDLQNNILSDDQGANRIEINVYPDAKSPLREIYNNLVDAYIDHVRLSAIMSYNQAKQLIPQLKKQNHRSISGDSTVIVDLYGASRASIQEMQADAFFDRMMTARKK